MGRWVFWSVALLMVGVTTHLGVVLFAPTLNMARVFDRIFAITPVNSMIVLDDEMTAAVLREPDPDTAYAICPFDISAGPLIVALDIPDTYWAMSVYSYRGDNIYTLNDRQSGERRLKMRLEQDQFIPLDERIPSLREGNTFIVRSPTNRGAIILRAFVPNEPHMERVRSALGRSSCTPQIS